MIEVLHSTTDKMQPTHLGHRGTDSKTKTQHVTRKQKVDQLSDVDYVPTSTHSSHNESQLYIFEDNEAVIKMTIQRTKSHDETCVTELLLVGWLTESTWNLKSKSNMLTPKNNSLTF